MRIPLVEHVGGKKVVVYALTVGLVATLALAWGLEGAGAIVQVLTPVVTMGAAYFGINAALTNQNGGPAPPKEGA